MEIKDFADVVKTKPIKANQTQPVVSLSNLFQSQNERKLSNNKEL